MPAREVRAVVFDLWDTLVEWPEPEWTAMKRDFLVDWTGPRVTSIPALLELL